MKPFEHIKKIQSVTLDQNEWNKENLMNAIKALATELYRKDTHFIFELIQNAEDNTYKKDVDPSLTFKLLKDDFTKTNNSDGILIIENNEIGFKEENIDAICKVGGTTKKKNEGYIGEKGIGFKSVFKISSCPHIFSNGYSFKLPEMDEKTNLGYIFPIWVDNIPSIIDKSKTTILLPLDKKNFKEVSTFLINIDIESILFLSKLLELKIEIEGEHSISIMKDTSKFPFVDLLFKSKNSNIVLNEYYLITDEYTKPENIYNEKRININKRKVTIALPLKKNQNDSNKLFAYLPVEENTGLPFIINADFLLTSSREGIKVDESWNKWLRDCVSDVFVKGFEKGLLNKDIREKLYGYIPLKTNIEFLEPIVPEIQTKLKNTKCILSFPDYKLVFPENARFVVKDFRILLDKNYPKALLEYTRIIIPSIEKYKKQLQKIGVITIEHEIIKKVFNDKAWLELHNSDWLLKCYNFLRKQNIEKEELLYLPLVPISKKEDGGFVLSSRDIQPIYFECVTDVEESLNQIDSKIPIKIEFVEKDFFTLIKKDDALKEWMTEFLAISHFSKEDYAIDLYDWFVHKYYTLSDEEFINLSFQIIDFAAENQDFPEFPLLLEFGKGRFTKDDLERSDKIQSIVTPINYDPKKGWQNIWKDEEDRKHLAILSNKYLLNGKENVFKKFIKINNIKEFPLPFFVNNVKYSYETNMFEKNKLSAITKTNRKAISNFRPPLSLKNFDSLYQNSKKSFFESMIEWLKTNTKYLNDYNYIYDETDWGQAYITYFYYKPQPKTTTSEFLEALQKKEWLMTTKGFLAPNVVFLKKKSIFDIFGDSIPYIEKNALPEKIINILRINNEISFEKVIKLLESLKNKNNVELDLIKKIYKYLDTLYDSEMIRNLFIKDKLIFIPNRSDSNWFTSKEVFWSDKSDVFGDIFPYLVKHYPKLKSFFLDKLKINDVINPQKYAQQWINIQNSNDPDISKIENALTKIYKELLPIFKINEKPNWWDEFIQEALIWTQNKAFIESEYVYVADDMELKSVFKNKNLNLFWKPASYTNSDMEFFYNDFQLKYLSKEVDISIDSKGNEKIYDIQFLTKSSKILILSWLFNKQRNDYNRVCENGLSDYLLNTKEINTEILKVRYELDNIPVIKERNSFWHYRDRKLFYTNSKDDLKISIAYSIARTLLPTKAYKDFAIFILAMLSSKEWEKRFIYQDFKLSKELKKWLSDSVDINDEIPIEQKEESNNSNYSKEKSENTNTTDDLNKAEDYKRPFSSSDKKKSLIEKSNKMQSTKNSDTNFEQNDIDNNNHPINNNNLDSKDDDSFNPIFEFNNAFDKRNKYISPKDYEDDGYVKNPDRRSEKNWQSLSYKSDNEPDKNERYKRKERKIFEVRDKQVKEFLRQMYNGECQICGKTFRKSSDGTNYFNATYLIPRKLKRQVDLNANALCLCPEHFAKFLYGSVVADPSFTEQILSLKISKEGGNGNLSVKLNMCGEPCKITYKEKHLKDLQDMIEFYSIKYNKKTDSTLSKKPKLMRRSKTNSDDNIIKKEKPKILPKPSETNKNKTMKSVLGITPKDITMDMIKKMHHWSVENNALSLDLRHKLLLVMEGTVPFKEYFLIVVNCLDKLVKKGITKKDLDLKQ